MLNNYTSDYICPHGNKTFHLFTLLCFLALVVC